MSGNETLDLDQLNRDFTDAVCSMRVPFNRLVADVLARIPRLIAAVRERDAEIARLKDALRRIGIFRSDEVGDDGSEWCVTLEPHGEEPVGSLDDALRVTLTASHADGLREASRETGTEPPQPAEGA